MAIVPLLISKVVALMLTASTAGADQKADDAWVARQVHEHFWGHLSEYTNRRFFEEERRLNLCPLRTQPLNFLERSMNDIIRKHFKDDLSPAEFRLLGQNPQHIANVQKIQYLADQIAWEICPGPPRGNPDESINDNDNDALRHAIGSYMLAKVSNRRFAERFLLAHESHSYGTYPSGSAIPSAAGDLPARTLMDIHNNSVGIYAFDHDDAYLVPITVEPDGPVLINWDEFLIHARQVARQILQRRSLIAFDQNPFSQCRNDQMREEFDRLYRRDGGVMIPRDLRN